LIQKKTWQDLTVKQIKTFDAKSKRNLVGAFSWQMEYLELGTKSREKTAKKYRKDISKFFKDQTYRMLERYDQFFNIKQPDFPINQVDYLVELMFPRVEDLMLEETARPMHTSAIQKAPDDINSIATNAIAIDTSLSNPDIVLRLNALGKLITRVNGSSQRIIRDVILRGIRDGDNVLTIRDSILKAGLNEYYENRALTIARTETRAAYDAGSKLALDKTTIKKFDVIGCVGTLGIPNALGLIASYGDFKETMGSCGVLGVDMLLWDAVSSLHHVNHGGMAVSAARL